MAPSTAPELSVVIPTSGRAELLGAALAALLRQDYDLARAEIVVVLDGPDPETRALVARLAEGARCQLACLEQPRRGQAAARNAGIRKAVGRVVLMLDDDIIADPRLLAEHARHHAARQDLVVIGNVPVEPSAGTGEPAHHRAVRAYWARALALKNDPGHRPTFTDFVTGNVSVPRARLLEIGGFDEAFTGYGREDYELGYRLQRAGLRFVYEPRALGLHRYRKEPLEWIRQSRDMGRADVLLARKHPELAAEVMTLAPFPRVPWLVWVVALSERVTLGLNARGGAAWGIAATLAQGAHYWRGVHETASDPAERRWLLRARAAST